MYGVFLDITNPEPSLYECSINCLIIYCARSLPSLLSTADNDSSHSLVSLGSISFVSETISIFEFSSLEVFLVSETSCLIIFGSSIFCIFSASLIIFSVSFGISVSFLTSLTSSIFSLSPSTEIETNLSPFETLSPILTDILSIIPSSVDGTSTLDLSLSNVTIGSLIEIFWPCFTNSSIISTFSKSPISGTKRSFFII